MMSRRLRHTAAVLLSWTMGFVPGLSYAETAEETMARALKEFVRGEWEKSAAMLRAVAPKLADPKRRATAWKTIGLAEVERRRVADAEAAFVEALTADPLIDVDPVEDTPAAVALFRSVRGRLEGRVDIRVNRVDARLSIDGVDVGTLPYRGAVKIGRRRIRASTPDGVYAVARDDVVVRVGDNEPLNLVFKPRVALPLPIRQTPALVKRGPRKMRPWGVAALGVGAAALLAGTLTYVLPQSPSTSGLTRDEYTSRIGSFNGTLKIGIGLFVVGGVTLAGSGVIFALHRDSEPRRSAAPLTRPDSRSDASLR